MHAASGVAIHDSIAVAGARSGGLSGVRQVNHNPVLGGLLVVTHARVIHILDDSRQDPGNVVNTVEALPSNDIQALDGCTQTNTSLNTGDSFKVPGQQIVLILFLPHPHHMEHPADNTGDTWTYLSRLIPLTRL